MPIWTMTHAQPGNDYLQSQSQLQEFRTTLRRVFNDIKAVHGESGGTTPVSGDSGIGGG